MISPNQKMRLIVSPQVSISHVSNEFNTVLDSLAILLFLVDVVASYPLSLHNCLDLGFLLGFEEEQVILRQNKIVLLAYPIFLILGVKWGLKENVLLIDRDGSIRCLPQLEVFGWNVKETLNGFGHLKCIVNKFEFKDISKPLIKSF